MSETGPKHISFPNCFSNIDYNHYIEKQLKGVSDDILSSLNFDFDKLAGLDNKGLTNFF